MPNAPFLRAVAEFVGRLCILGLWGAIAGCARAAEYRGFGAPRAILVAGYRGDAMEPFITRDGRYLIFNNRNDPPDRTDLFVARRIDDTHFAEARLLAGANSRNLDAVASVDRRGRIWFVSTRAYRQTLATIFSGSFRDGQVGGVAAVAGLSTNRSGFVDFDAEIDAAGDLLYYVEGDFRGSAGVPSTATIKIAQIDRTGAHPMRNGAALLARVDAGFVYAPCISSDGLELFFTRKDGFAPPQIYRAARLRPDRPFGAPARVAAIDGFAEAPSLSSNGRILYFHRRIDGRFALFEVSRNESGSAGSRIQTGY